MHTSLRLHVGDAPARSDHGTTKIALALQGHGEDLSSSHVLMLMAKRFQRVSARAPHHSSQPARDEWTDNVVILDHMSIWPEEFCPVVCFSFGAYIRLQDGKVLA